ncbi:MAG: hypothetical protein IT458_10050 [Planctomycetes bacterium]|nr:hypothetical protein [Planctomycetota bacterium]
MSDTSPGKRPIDKQLDDCLDRIRGAMAPLSRGTEPTDPDQLLQNVSANTAEAGTLLVQLMAELPEVALQPTKLLFAWVQEGLDHVLEVLPFPIHSRVLMATDMETHGGTEDEVRASLERVLHLAGLFAGPGGCLEIGAEKTEGHTVLTVLASGPEAETVTDHERQRRFWSVQEFAKDFGAQVSVSTPHPDRLLVHFTLPTGARTA